MVTNSEQEQGATGSGADYLEPWMRGTNLELDPVLRAVVHALELTREDVRRHCAQGGELLFAESHGLPSPAFHVRHIVRSLDRLLTYAEGRQLDESQRSALTTEHHGADPVAVLQEFEEGMAKALARVRQFRPEHFQEVRGIGRKQLPTTLAGLLIHCADHSQRHAGQVVTTMQLLQAR